MLSRHYLNPRHVNLTGQHTNKRKVELNYIFAFTLSPTKSESLKNDVKQDTLRFKHAYALSSHEAFNFIALMLITLFVIYANRSTSSPRAPRRLSFEARQSTRSSLTHCYRTSHSNLQISLISGFAR